MSSYLWKIMAENLTINSCHFVLVNLRHVDHMKKAWMLRCGCCAFLWDHDVVLGRHSLSTGLCFWQLPSAVEANRVDSDLYLLLLCDLLSTLHHFFTLIGAPSPSRVNDDDVMTPSSQSSSWIAVSESKTCPPAVCDLRK